MAIDITEEIVEILDDKLEVVHTKLSHKKTFMSKSKHNRFSSKWQERYVLPNKYKKILASLVGKTEKEVRAKLLISGNKGEVIETTMLNNIYDYYFYGYDNGYLTANGRRIHTDDYHTIYYYIDGILHSTSNPKQNIVKKDTTKYSNIYEIKDNCITFIVEDKNKWGKQLFRKVVLKEGHTDYIFPTYTIKEAESVNSKILLSYHEKDRFIYVNNRLRHIDKKANFDMIEAVYLYSHISNHTYTIAYNGNFYLGKLVEEDWDCPNDTITMTAKEAEKSFKQLKNFISTK